MANYKLTLCYEGTRYRGWQKQGNTDKTIQGRLEAALSRLHAVHKAESAALALTLALPDLVGVKHL